jgi:hypothetical protein
MILIRRIFKNLKKNKNERNRPLQRYKIIKE